MRYCKLGGTGLKISRLSFGAGQLQPLKRKEAVAMLCRVIEEGINYIDIDKQNDESLVAEAIRKTGKKIILSGKSFARTEKEMESDLRESLRIYSTDHMDIYFLHAVSDRNDLVERLGGSMRVLRKAKEDGIVGNIGITSNRIEVLKVALTTGMFDVCCMPFNIEHQIGESLFEIIKRDDVGLITFMSFGGGVLVDPAYEEDIKPLLTFHGPLRFVLSKDEIDSVIIGTNKRRHLDPVLEYAQEISRDSSIKMGKHEEQNIRNSIHKVLGKDFCRGCKNCINDPAREKIEIDIILRLKVFAEKYGYVKHAKHQYKERGIKKLPAALKDASHPDWGCPYGINIPEELTKAHALLTGTKWKETDYKIKKRCLGRTGIEVSSISIGGGAFNKEEVRDCDIWQVVSEAIKHGVNFIETSQEYGETKFAPSIRKAKSEGYPLIISSKSVASTFKDMQESINESLRNLATDFIHIYQLQTVTSPEDFELRIKHGALKALQEAKASGHIGAIGISSHRIPALLAAIRSGEIDVIELPYSIGQHKSRVVLKEAKRHDVGVIAIMTLGGGLLVDRDKRSAYAEHMTPANALRFVLSDDRVHTALVGMGSKEHLLENLKAIEEKPTLNRLERIRVEKKTKSILGKDFCRSCKACMPCEVFGWAFSIDNFFRFQTFSKVYGYPQYSEEYQKLPILADACTECGLCEPRCPYNIPIIKRLKEVHKELGGETKTDRAKLPGNIQRSVEEYLTREIEKFKKEKRIDEGIQFMEEQLTFFPDNPVLLRNIGECHMELAQYDEAIRYLERARGIRKRTDWLHFSLGKCYFKQGTYEKAMEMFKKNLKHCHSEESHFHTWYFMAMCHRKMRQYDQMKECLNRAREFTELFDKGEVFEEKQLRGFAENWPAPFFHEEFKHFRELKEYEEGIQFGLEQLKEYPDSAVLHHYIGELYMELEEYGKAIEHLSKAVQLKPEMEWTHFSLGKTLFLSKRYEEAEKALKDNLRLTSERLSHFHSLLFLAMAAEARNDARGCREALNGLKGFTEFVGKEIPVEIEFLTKLKEENRLPVWLKWRKGRGEESGGD